MLSKSNPIVRQPRVPICMVDPGDPSAPAMPGENDGAKTEEGENAIGCYYATSETLRSHVTSALWPGRRQQTRLGCASS